MKWLSWLGWKHRTPPAAAVPSPTSCPTCGEEMTLIDRTTFTGHDMRTYRCARCGREHVLDFGTALWKMLSDARRAEGADE